MTKLWGIVSGLSLAWSMGYMRVCLETDLRVAILLLNKPIDRSHPLFSLASRVKGLISRDWFCQARHIYREANFVADALASFALCFPLGLYFLADLPECVLEFISSDIRGRATPRTVLL